MRRFLRDARQDRRLELLVPEAAFALYPARVCAPSSGASVLVALNGVTVDGLCVEATRSPVVIGFSVSLEAPSTVSVAQVLTHAVLPKDVWVADRELEVPWPMFGMPRLLHLDNASESHSEALARAGQQHGIRLEFRPIAEPHYDGHCRGRVTNLGADGTAELCGELLRPRAADVSRTWGRKHC